MKSETHVATEKKLIAVIGKEPVVCEIYKQLFKCICKMEI
jgi:hypothetical protein